MSIDIAEWLRGFGLEQYAPAFRDNHVDGEVLRRLTAEDLRELGVASIGHRRRLLDAIAALGEGGPSTEAPPAPIPALATASEAERRQLTVMFCDLVGSTPLSTRFDPEDLREIVGAYHSCVADTVSRFGGFVAKYMGDGVLVYFGYPRAHDDDAERAVRAGLGLIDAVARLDVKSVELQARIGIATGLVVVGDLIGEGSAQEQSVVGETPNLAARLQTMAEPGTVVIAAGTRRLVGDLFEYRELGAVALRGLAAPVSAWHVLRPSVVASRFEALRGSTLTPLVGRDEEIDLLLRRWARVKAGDGQVVLISGEAGIGKSRLTAALVERLYAEPHLRLRYFCSPYHQDSALYPFIGQLERAAGFTRDDTNATRLDKLEALLGDGAEPGDISLIGEMLSLSGGERFPPLDLSPQRKKERTLAALLRELEGLARLQPVVMVFEDLHWIDPTSRELLDLTVEKITDLPVLMVVTFRPEFQPAWIGQPQVSVLTLNRLDRNDRTVLVEQIAGGKPLSPQVIAHIADRADGVPLFVEELTKSVLESGVATVGIPATLHDSLMARLDRLESVRRVAQIGAAIGREFSYELLRAVSGLPADALRSALDRLVASELVFQRGTPPEALYSFKHALVQDAAHNSLLRVSRQQLHAQIAESIAIQSPELMDSQPELFAQHYAEAGLVEKSAAFWGRAGHRSIARSVMTEAAAQFQKGLDQLALMPANPERQHQELQFYSTLSAVWIAVKGWTAPETGHAYARAQELWEELGSPADLLRVPYGRVRYLIGRGELDLARQSNADLLRISEQRNDLTGLVLGHTAYGGIFMFAGQFASSRSHYEEGVTLCDRVSLRSLVHQIGFYPQVTSQGQSGLDALCLGFPDQGLALSNKAVAEARKLDHPPSLASSLAVDALLLALVEDNAALKASADALVAVTAEQGFAFWGALGTIYCGWVKVTNGDLAEGISLLQSGLVRFRAGGMDSWTPCYMAFLARAYASVGRVEEALAVFDDALHIVDSTQARWFAAELNRYKGELLLRQRRIGPAEESYFTALGIAREQEAKLWELRAATSLARLWREQGRRAEARDLLAPLYGWFTEGFDTADLKDAKGLLEELS